MPVGLGTGLPGAHSIVRLLESDGTHREEDHGGEEHVPDADRRARPDRGHLHEPSRHHREILLRSRPARGIAVAMMKCAAGSRTCSPCEKRRQCDT